MGSCTMSALRFLQVALLISHLTFLIAVDIDVNCQNFKFVIDEDVVYDHILEGHVFKRLTVFSATHCHVMCKDNCLCASMNYFPVSKENNCELSDVNKEMEPAALTWKQGVNYYDLVRSYTVKGGDKYIPGKHRCVNRCCSDNPCVNGGVCEEICDPHSTRFNCTCPDTHTGQRCEEIKCPRTCKDIAKNGATTSGKYLIFDSTNEAFSVFCDMVSEPGFVWTLIQSFSLAKEDMFANKSFSVDFPVNQGGDDVDWNSYRLSLSQMQSIADHSTHLRATCNFPTDGLQYTDYARAKLEGHDIFGNWDSLCRLYEYINIRGNECSNCTALTKQKNGKAWIVKSHKSKELGCEFDGAPGASQNENNFGRYSGGGEINSNHRCSSSPASTTQHWFGVKHE
ncbi:uncharacterized protein LOC144641786 isoform X1 [Oculina patagonica]